MPFCCVITIAKNTGTLFMVQWCLLEILVRNETIGIFNCQLISPNSVLATVGTDSCKLNAVLYLFRSRLPCLECISYPLCLSCAGLKRLCFLSRPKAFFFLSYYDAFVLK